MLVPNLKILPQIPEGAYYLLFSIKDYLGGTDYWEFIDQCFEKGVSVAPD